MFYDMFSVHMCDIFRRVYACLDGWLAGKAEFDGLSLHYQYTDCAKSQYEHNIVYETLYATQNTRHR